MKTTTIFRFILITLICGLILSACQEKQEGDFVIGFSQCISEDPWRQAMHEEMKREMYFHKELKLIIKEADENTTTQIKQIDEFIKQNVDVLIVSPLESTKLIPIIDKAYKKGIPVILLDRKIDSDNYTAYLGANNYEIGYMAGNYVREILPNGGSIIEVWGEKKATPTVERHKGFHDAIKKKPNLFTIKEIDGANTKEEFNEKNKNSLDSIEKIDIVFSHTDHLALIGSEFINRKFPSNKNIKFLGVDGLFGPDNGIDLVEKNILEATLLYPTGGAEAIKLAKKIIDNEPYKKDNSLVTTLINNSNVELIKSQEEKMLNQQRNIELQQNYISIQNQLNEKQSHLVAILITSLFTVLILGAFLFYAYKEKKMMNYRLRIKNKKIKKQKNHIKKISKKNEEISQAKFKFFTNISHEFRTPLMLIQSPIEDLLKDENINKPQLQNLTIIKRNALRLQKLINQLMDFRKIEHKKYNISASESDIIAFVNDFMLPFQKMADDRKIDFKLIHNLDTLPLWFDPNMLDKVLFNLFSNAFKFTKKYGKIHVVIDKHIETNEVSIKIIDDGRGMTSNEISKVFDRFYEANNIYFQGTGLGLSLSKELITLHKGTIKINESIAWKHTEFEILLPLGKNHLKPEQINTSEELQIIKAEDNYLYDFEFDTVIDDNDKSKSNTLLIVEDNKDLSNYLRKKFSPVYNIITAFNGESGIKKAFKEVPDIILCDVSLPKISGLDVVTTLKNDIKTSHVPIILLTSKSEEHDKVIGLRSGADSYITKPFNIEFLTEKIKSKLQNRELLKKYYLGSIANNKSESDNIETIFIKDFKNLVAKNYKDPQFGVEDIYKALGLSRIQLYRKVKALIGCGVHDFLIDYRLEKAKELLFEDPNSSISDIAYDVGFSSPTHFSTSFKNKYHSTPSKVRQANLTL